MRRLGPEGSSGLLDTERITGASEGKPVVHAVVETPAMARPALSSQLSPDELKAARARAYGSGNADRAGT